MSEDATLGCDASARLPQAGIDDRPASDTNVRRIPRSYDSGRVPFDQDRTHDQRASWRYVEYAELQMRLGDAQGVRGCPLGRRSRSAMTGTIGRRALLSDGDDHGSIAARSAGVHAAIRSITCVPCV